MHNPRPAPAGKPLAVRLTMVLAALVVGLAARSGAAGTPARTMLELEGNGLPAF